MSPHLDFAPLAVAAAQPQGFLENLMFALLGILIVMVALAALWLLCEGIGLLFKQLEAESGAQPTAEGQAPVAPAPQAPAQPAAAVPVAIQAQDAGVPLVVLAAAVAAVIDQPHRVIEVRPASPAWSMEGRRQLLGSHQLRR